VKGLDASFGSVHEYHQKENHIERQTDRAVTLFALMLDKVVFAGHGFGSSKTSFAISNEIP
jgi:hypothetical protein